MLPDITFPLTLTFPADAPIAVIGGQWQRLEDGRIRATYKSREELRLCIMVAACAERMCDLCSATQQHACRRNGGKPPRKKFKQSQLL